jgi:hypothetical protein
LQRRVERDFPAHEVTEVLRLLVAASPTERVQAAVVLAADGDLEAVRADARLALVDWRDVLMHGPLAHGGWRARLDEELGTDT